MRNQIALRRDWIRGSFCYVSWGAMEAPIDEFNSARDINQGRAIAYRLFILATEIID